MKNKFFGMAEAYSVCERYPLTGEFGEDSAYLDLSEYTHADPMAFKYLASQGERNFLEIGLRQLDVQTATILLACSSHLDFKNLDYLSPEVASVLSEAHGILSIDGLRDVKIEAISELVKCGGEIFLSFAGGLTMEIATELTKHRGMLFVRAPDQPSICIQLKLFYAYSGYVVTLQFPSNGENINSDFYSLCHRNIKVELIKWDSGEAWYNVTAIDNPELWRERMEFIQSGISDGAPD